MRARTWTFVALAAAAALSACRTGFRLSRYTTSPALYEASTREFQKRHWANAILGFEKLTNDLPARDTLLPRAYWYLATAHDRQKEHLLAAQSYTRLYESFPDDTSADDAALEAARAFRRLWRKPVLDATYGETSLATYSTLLGLFPSSEHADAARAETVELEQAFATKNFETGRYYFRRKAYDSAVIYLKTVIERWPHVPRARDAMLLLAETYRVIKYREDLNDICAAIRSAYPDDPGSKKVCASVRVADTTTAAPKPPASR
ncbi:MAG: outer membrane protein assembly factor BamD [Gemmatimonadota bacterium]